MPKIQEIPIEKIVTGEHSVRAQISNDSVNDLLSSISRIGIVCPIVVQKDGDSYKVVFGHRRFRAAQLANLKTVSCIVRHDAVTQVKEIAFAENFFRADLSPIEQASAIKDVIDTGSMTIQQVAAGFNRTDNWVARQVSILTWPADILEAVHVGWLSVAAAANLALIEEDTYRSFLLRNAEESGCTARVSASWLQAWRSMAPPEAALEAEPVPAGRSVIPALPQAPCICCSQIKRTDELSSVLICPTCINAIRTAR